MDDDFFPLGGLRTRVLCAARRLCDETWARGGALEHIDPFGRLYLLRSGAGLIRLRDGRTVELRPGRLVVIPAHVAAFYQCAGMDLTYAHFTAEPLDGVELFSLLRWDLSVELAEPGVEAALFDALVSAWPRRDGGGFLEADGLLRQLLARFAATGGQGSGRLDGILRLRPVLELIERNLHRPIRLAELARAARLQPNYLSNLFAAQMGVAPARYIVRRRVEKAERLLRMTRQGLKEIAASLGFENQFYFSRVFKNSSVKSSRSRQLRADYAPLLAGRSHGRKMSGFDGWLARNGITQLIRLPPCQCHQLKAQMACSEQFGRHRKSLAPVAFSLLSRDFQLNRPWLSLVTGNFPLRAPGPAMGNGKSDAFSTRFSFLGEGGLTISPHR